MPEQTLIEIPSLFGGVSKQAPHVRHPSQVESATNTGFSPAIGAYKRPGTKFVAYLGNARIKVTGVSVTFFNVGDAVTQAGASPVTATVVSVTAVNGSAGHYYLTLAVTAGTLELTTALNSVGGATGVVAYLQSQYTAGMELRLHPILRDKNESYLMILGSAVAGPVAQVPRVFPLSGAEAEILYEGGVEATQKTYLASGSPSAKDYRTLSVADTTYIANTQIALVGNNAAGTIDKTTMPHFIQRTALTPQLQFTISAIAWTPRGVGDGTSNPLPASISGSKKVSDMVQHKSRFGIAAGPYVDFTAVNTLSFFIQTAPAGTVTVIASDPISFTLPGNSITSVDRVVGYRNDLIVFGTPQTQFEITEISNTTSGFAPGNVQINPTTQYATVSIPPVPFRTGIVFGSAQREAGCVFYFRYDDLSVTNTADELTLVVQGLLGANIVRIAGDTNTGSLFVLTTNDTTSIYPFQQTVQNGKVAVNAWFDKWTFSGMSRICDIGTLNGVLYILGELPAGGYVLEGMSIGTTVTTASGTIAPSGASSSITGEAGDVVPDA